MTLTLLQMHRYGNILPADLEKQTYLNSFIYWALYQYWL